jgi:quinol monooxygenase YgiN
MKAKEVSVTGMMKAKEGMEDRPKEELMSLVASTRKEAGCIIYDLHQALDDNSLFLFYENWASKDDLDKHLETPHLKAFREKAKRLLAVPTDIKLWTRFRE